MRYLKPYLAITKANYVYYEQQSNYNYNHFRFVRAFRERVSPEQRPIVVHCSAGVGRSGTMIAIDRILQGIRKYDVVDIFGIVYEMRKERVWMVQTEQQYICIHQVGGIFIYWVTQKNFLYLMD